MGETPQDPPVTRTRECCICSEEATRIIFSSAGHWKLCDKPACWNELTHRYDDTELTWLAKALPKKK